MAGSAQSHRYGRPLLSTVLLSAVMASSVGAHRPSQRPPKWAAARRAATARWLMERATPSAALPAEGETADNIDELHTVAEAIARALRTIRTSRQARRRHGAGVSLYLDVEAPAPTGGRVWRASVDRKKTRINPLAAPRAVWGVSVGPQCTKRSRYAPVRFLPEGGHTVVSMDARDRRTDTTRIVGNIALAVGLLITVVGLVTDSTPAKGYVFAGMLVFAGTGLRLEAAVTDHR